MREAYLFRRVAWRSWCLYPPGLLPCVIRLCVQWDTLEGDYSIKEDSWLEQSKHYDIEYETSRIATLVIVVLTLSVGHLLGWRMSRSKVQPIAPTSIASISIGSPDVDESVASYPEYAISILGPFDGPVLVVPDGSPDVHHRLWYGNFLRATYWKTGI